MNAVQLRYTEKLKTNSILD